MVPSYLLSSILADSNIASISSEPVDRHRASMMPSSAAFSRLSRSSRSVGKRLSPAAARSRRQSSSPTAALHAPSRTGLHETWSLAATWRIASPASPREATMLILTLSVVRFVRGGRGVTADIGAVRRLFRDHSVGSQKVEGLAHGDSDGLGECGLLEPPPVQRSVLSQGGGNGGAASGRDDRFQLAFDRAYDLTEVERGGRPGRGVSVVRLRSGLLGNASGRQIGGCDCCRRARMRARINTF